MTRYQRWLITLWRHCPPCPPASAFWRGAALGAVLAASVAGPAPGATLRPFTQLSGPLVKLSDLFAELGGAPDRALGPGPAPGDRIVVEAPQLAAIARDFGVAWRPSSGAERAVLERAGAPLPLPPVLAALREALAAAGAPEDAELELPGYDPPTISAGSTPTPAIAQLGYDNASGRFSALLSVTQDSAPPLHVRLAGQVMPVMTAAVLTRRLRPGTVLTADDVRATRLRAALLRGNAPLAASAAIGQALRRDVPLGQPLTAADVTRPRLVARNDAVHLRLEAGGISLNAQGIALEEGGLGDRIRVQNPSSHAVVLGEISGAGEVRVMPGAVPVVVAAQ